MFGQTLPDGPDNLFDAHEVIDDRHFQCFVVAVLDALPLDFRVKRADLFHQSQEYPPAIGQVARGNVGFLRAHGFDVQADERARFGISAQFQHADLIEGGAQVGAAEGFVLIKFQPVLVIEVDAPEFAEGQGEGHFVRRVQAGKLSVRGFDSRDHS